MIRLFDIILSTMGLVFLLPVLLIISVLIKITSPGPIFYIQIRVGKLGSQFNLLKFRTMHVNADQKGLLTVGGRDPRVSSIGYYLRKYKIDELPQLLNVLFGQMSLVGPRPEVQKYVDTYTKSQKRILEVRPGITDWASINFKDENSLLEKSENPELTYITEIIPKKIEYNYIFINNQTVSEYFKIIFHTLSSVIR